MNSETRTVVLWGAGGHAKVAADIARLTGYTVEGFLDDVTPERRGTSFYGATILGTSKPIDRFASHWLFLAIGDCAGRLAAAEQARDAHFPILTHPSAVVASDAVIGPGTLLVAGAILNPDCQLGTHCIINTGATIDHECVLEDGVHISPGAHLGGRVHVGRGAWVGLGASIKPGVRIGAGAVVGVGAVVIRDVPAGEVVAGVPARALRTRRGSA